ncbi:MAG: hypothetical protein ACNA8W_18120 [Bradymonadaceae bacterium]
MRLLPAFICTALLVLATSSCQRSPVEQTPEPWKFQSAAAPYELIMPGAWIVEDGEEINPYADFAASLDDSIFLIIIPQELPIFPMPDLTSFKSASVDLLRDNLDEFQIQRQGSIVLDGHEGHTVFIKGLVVGERIQYIATYVTRDVWGYQIIAWGPVIKERDLIDHVDAILTKWRFTGPRAKAPEKMVSPVPSEATN